MKRRRKVLDADTSIRGRDGSRINTYAACPLCAPSNLPFSLPLPPRYVLLPFSSCSLPPSLPPSLSLSLFLPPFLHHSRLVDPKYQRTIKYSSDDSFVTDERREPRARACDINVYIREDEDSDRLCRR